MKLIKMSEAIRKSLNDALTKHQDFEGFRSIIRSVGLPRDESYTDYALLTKAIKLGCMRIVRLLLDKGARVFKKQGIISPLHVAVTKSARWTKVIERLLEKGAKVSDKKNSQGDTVLHVAFAHRAPGQLIDFLLRKYLEEDDKNLANSEKLSLLHIACTRPHVDVVEQLIGPYGLANQQVSARSNTIYAGYTPMHFAVAHGNYEVADFLLKISCHFIYSADVNQSSPLHLAAKKRDVNMIDLILGYDKVQHVCSNKDGLTHFMAACMGSDARIVENFLCPAEEKPWMLSSSTLINSRVKSLGDFGGYTPLHFAAEYGRPDTIEILLNKGADCCATTHRGVTVHELAKKNVRDLLQSHCNVFKECENMRVDDYDFGDVNGNISIFATLSQK